MEYRNVKEVRPNVFECEVEHPDYGWIPYGLDLKDRDNSHVDTPALIERIKAKGDYVAYVPPTQEELDEEAANIVRFERNQKLRKQVDPLVTNPLRWADLTAEKKVEWTQYRRDLLDITEQAGFPHDIVWPIKPE